MSRTWSIVIPVRPKCVQSTRYGKGGFHPDRAVTLWKAKIRPYIQAACMGPPSALPIKVASFRYLFKYPQATPKRIKRYIDDGGIVPYTGTADITDNLNKGTVDVCSGLVFVDDRQIWWTADIRKQYWSEDRIELVFEETPDVILIDGKRAGGGSATDGEFAI